MMDSGTAQLKDEWACGNAPAPDIPASVQAELTLLGGLVPDGNGEFSGKPVFKLVWGQSEKHYRRGRRRIRFLDRTKPLLVTQERYFLSPEAFALVAEWQKQRNQATINRFLTGDLGALSKHYPISAFLKEKVSALEYFGLPSVRAPRSRLMPDYRSIVNVAVPLDWMYLSDVAEVEEIGKALWYVVRWISAAGHGGEKDWENLRWKTNGYVPELNTILPIVDELGEFPKHGAYIGFIEIAEYPKDEEGRELPGKGTYLEPNYKNCIEPVQETLYEEARESKQSAMDKLNADYESAPN